MLMDDIDRKNIKNFLQEKCQNVFKNDRRKDIPVISGRFCKNRKNWKKTGSSPGIMPW